MDKLCNSTFETLRPSHAQRSHKEMMGVRCEWDFSRMFIVMSVKPTLTDELPGLPVYNGCPCIIRTHIFGLQFGKKKRKQKTEEVVTKKI